MLAAEQGVDVADGQAGVVECTLGALGHDLELGLVRRPAGRVLVDAGDGDLSGEAHALVNSPRNEWTRSASAAGCSSTPRRPAPGNVTARPAGSCSATASAVARRSGSSCLADDHQRRGGEVRQPVADGPRRQGLHVAQGGPRIGLDPLAERLLVDGPVRVRRVAAAVELTAGLPAGDAAQEVDLGLERARVGGDSADQHERSRGSGPRRGGFERHGGTHAVAEQHRGVEAEPVGERTGVGGHGGDRLEAVQPARPPVRGHVERQRAVVLGQGVEHAGEDVAVHGQVVQADDGPTPPEVRGRAGKGRRAAVVQLGRDAVHVEVLGRHDADGSEPGHGAASSHRRAVSRTRPRTPGRDLAA